MHRPNICHLMILLPMLSAGLPAQAQQELAPPRILTRAEAPEIRNAAGNPVEGWAIVRYSVLENGAADHIRVVATVPDTSDRAPIVDSVEQWRFAPGTADGSAIDWHNNESVVLFAAAQPASTADFDDAYSALADSVGDVEFLEGLMDDEDALRDAIVTRATIAAGESQRLLNEIAVRRQDLALALVQAAIIEVGRRENSAALGPLQLATHAGVDALQPADLFLALQYEFQVESQLGRTVEALATYEKLAAGYRRGENNPFQAMAEELEEALEDEEFLPVFGRIEDTTWHIDLARGYFYIDDIEGRIDALTAECDTERLQIEFQPEADYKMQDSFGNCTIFVEGDAGTTFTLVEVVFDE